MSGLSVAEAVRVVLDAVPQVESEAVPIAECAGRVLAEPLVAREDVPNAAVSAMDGWAVASDETPGRFAVSPPTVYAGSDPGPPLAAGEARRVMTGGRIPEGADAVAMQEVVALCEGGGEVELPRLSPGANIRPAGDAIRAGSEVLPCGARIAPHALVAAIASGAREAVCARRPTVFVATTGDELVAGGDLPPGAVRETSRVPLAASVEEAGGIFVDGGIVPDDPGEIEAALSRGLACDLVVTIGGASVGEKDYLPSAVSALGGAIKFHGVAVKPGKPVGFALLEKRPVFFLPGNPVSVRVAFELFVRPALLAMQGARARFRPVVPARLTTSFRRKPGRPEFLRARVSFGPDGVSAEVFSEQGSHQVGALARTNALVMAKADCAELPEGAVVPAMLLFGEAEEEPPWP